MIRTYDPKKVLVSLGSHTVTGYTDGTFVKIEASGDGIAKKVGCDGEVVRFMDPDSSSKVTITVQQYSPTVAFTRRQYDLDRSTGNGHFPVLIKDLKGGFVFSAPAAWIVKRPGLEYGKEPSDCEIEIDTGEATWRGDSQ